MDRNSRTHLSRLRAGAFAIMAKYEKHLTVVARSKMRIGFPCVDSECLETLIFGASPP